MSLDYLANRYPYLSTVLFVLAGVLAVLTVLAGVSWDSDYFLAGGLVSVLCVAIAYDMRGSVAQD